MRFLSKSLILLLLVLLVISSVILVKPTFAQTTPKPSVPQFTLKLVRHVLEPTSPIPSIDPFTGKQTIPPNGGAPFEWTTIDITITNQAFNGKTEFGPYSYTGLMYDIEFKGHFINDWSQLTTINGEGGAGPYFTQNLGSNTLVSVDIGGGNIDTITTHAPNSRPDTVITIPDGAQVDFRIKALAGNVYTSPVVNDWRFNGTESEWSTTETITFNEADAITVIVQPIGQTPTPTLTPTPTVPELSWLAILPLFISLLSVAVILKLRHRKTISLNH